MKIYYTQKEVEADIKNGVLTINGDVKFECCISIEASITAENITARNITAWDINARNITAGDINAWNITAWNITAGNITAGDINAWNINAGDINARDINAWDISYYAFCCSYNSIKCTSIKAERDIHQEPICLDGKLEIKPTEDEEVTKAIKLLEAKGKLKDGKILA